MNSIIAITGATCDPTHLEVIRRCGWGRMWVGTKHPIKPFPGERWGFDNGAFVCWSKGKPWDEAVFLRSLEKARMAGTPYLACTPDIVAAGVRSLEFSMQWIDRLPLDWPWYLAVQDGMTLRDVEPLMPRFAGIFLGGSTPFKNTAGAWSRLAKQHGKRFHYARAGTRRKMRMAQEVGADSLDSAFPIWKKERREQFERWWRQLSLLERIVV